MCYFQMTLGELCTWVKTWTREYPDELRQLRMTRLDETRAIWAAEEGICIVAVEVLSGVVRIERRTPDELGPQSKIHKECKAYNTIIQNVRNNPKKWPPTPIPPGPESNRAARLAQINIQQDYIEALQKMQQHGKVYHEELRRCEEELQRKIAEYQDELDEIFADDAPEWEQKMAETNDWALVLSNRGTLKGETGLIRTSPDYLVNRLLGFNQWLWTQQNLATAKGTTLSSLRIEKDPRRGYVNGPNRRCILTYHLMFPSDEEGAPLKVLLRASEGARFEITALSPDRVRLFMAVEQPLLNEICRDIWRNLHRDYAEAIPILDTLDKTVLSPTGDVVNTVRGERLAQIPTQMAGRKRDPWNARAIGRLSSGDPEDQVRDDWREEYRDGTGTAPADTVDGEDKTWRKRVWAPYRRRAK